MIHSFLLLGEFVSPRITQIQRLLSSIDGGDVCNVRWLRSCDKEANAPSLDIVLPAPAWSAKILLKVPLYWYRLFRICKTLDSDSTCFVATHFFQLPVLFFLRERKVYDAAEMYSLDLAEYFGPFKSIARPFIAWLEGMMVRRLDGVLTVDSKGGWLEKHFRRWNPNVQVIWNVPSLADDPDSGAADELRPLYEGRRVVAYVGGLMREKGLRVAIEAAAIIKDRHPDVLFLFIGPMKDDPDQVYELIRHKGLQGHVRILEPIPYREMMAHLAHAEIGLALHQKERIYDYVSAGNGRKFFTYMQAGLAIIGPNFGEVGKAVTLADCGVLVDTHNAPNVAEAVIGLLGNPKLMARYQRNAREAFETRFNWEIEQEKVIRFFERLQ